MLIQVGTNTISSCPTLIIRLTSTVLKKTKAIVISILTQAVVTIVLLFRINHLFSNKEAKSLLQVATKYN